MNIVCFGQQNWDYCWTGKQQLMTRLAQRGHRVLYIDPDMAMDGVKNRRDHLRALAPEISRFGIREVGPGTLYVYTYQFAPAIGWRLNARRHEMAIANIASLLGFHNPVAMSMRPDAAKRIQSVRPRVVLYQAIDEWVGFGRFESDQAEAERIRKQEEDLIRECEVAFGISPVLQERIKQINPRTYLLESGADVDHFAPGRLARAGAHPGVKDLPRPRLGFVGQVDARMDQDLVLFLARSRPGWSIILAGRQQAGVDFAAIAAEPNIHMLGYQPYDQLPNVVREFDVCLVPYLSTNLTNSCSPLKVFEYLATGKPVVSTPLMGLGSSRDAVVTAESPEEFLRAIEAALANPEQGRELRLARAEENSWERRADLLERSMEEAVALARGKRTISPRGLSPGELPERRLAFVAQMAGRARAERPGKILVARRGRVRDLIATLPMLSALRKHLPKARIVLGVKDSGPARQLLAESKNIDEIRETASAVSGFDVVFSGDADAFVPEVLQAGQPRRIGVYSGIPGQLLQTDLMLADPGRHEGIDYLESAGLLTGEDHGQAPPELPWDRAQAAVFGWEHLRTLGVPDGVAVVVVHPGSARQVSRLPAESFSWVVNQVAARYPEMWVAVTRTDGEAAVALDIDPALRGRVVDAAAGLRTTLGVIAAATAVIAGDSDVMHLARTIGTPLLAVLGPENDRRWGPWPVGPGPAVVLRNVVPCAPCARETCAAHYCMRSLQPEKVLAELDGMLSGEGNLPSPFGLVRKHRHMNWDAVAHDGFAVPRVSVLVLQDGAQQLAGATADTVRLEDLLSDVYLQTYPNLEVRIVRTGGGDADSRALAVRAGDPAAAWRTILDTVSGEYLAPMIPEVRWVPGTIAAHIGALIGHPDAAASYPRRAPLTRSRLVFHRSAVEEIFTRGEVSLDSLRKAGRLVPADISLPLLLRK